MVAEDIRIFHAYVGFGFRWNLDLKLQPSTIMCPIKGTLIMHHRLHSVRITFLLRDQKSVRCRGLVLHDYGMAKHLHIGGPVPVVPRAKTALERISQTPPRYRTFQSIDARKKCGQVA